MIPKSTLIVGAALWGVLVLLMCWHLNKTDNLRDKLGDMSEKASVAAVKQESAAKDMNSLERKVDAIDLRLKAMEERQIRVVPR